MKAILIGLVVLFALMCAMTFVLGVELHAERGAVDEMRKATELKDARLATLASRLADLERNLPKQEKQR
ncbi:protein of unknown function [Burkholderia multivorans]